MDWKIKFNDRFKGPDDAAKWLDREYPDWREEDSWLVAEWLAIEALGPDPWGATSVEDAKEIEDFLMQYYIGA
jgi:hypothetical protein